MLNTIERVVGVFGDAGNTRVLLFSLLLGALLTFVRESVGANAMVEKIVRKASCEMPDTQPC